MTGRTYMLVALCTLAALPSVVASQFVESAFPEDAASAYRLVVNVQLPERTRPEVVEAQFAPSYDMSRAVVIERAQGSVVPHETFAVGQGVTFRVRDGSESEAGVIPELSDGQAATFVDFPYAPGRVNTVELALERVEDGVVLPFDAERIELVRAYGAALPTRVSILDASNERVVLDRARVTGERITFPRVTTRKLIVTFELEQPLRLVELSVDGTEIRPLYKALRFLARPGGDYRIYLMPDRLVDVPYVERGSFRDVSDPVVVSVSRDVTINPAYTPRDSDGDGIADQTDNCPATPNSDQEDEDGNGTGDACEDLDKDGILAAEDNCPLDPNRAQVDTDGDGVGDACNYEENRLTERHEWVPWVGMGVALATLVILFALTVLQARARPEEGSSAEQFQPDEHREGGGAVANLALIVAIAALIIGWMAFDRTGEEKLGKLIKEQAVETYNDLDSRIFKREQATTAATTTATSTSE